MNPNIWGPHAWIFLHTITLNYPNFPTNEEKEQHKKFFESLQHTIPCLECAKHYGNNVKKYPLTPNILKNRNNLVRWLINMHNQVNISTNKPTLTVDKVIRIYYDLYRPKTVFDYVIIHIDQLIIITLIIILIILSKDRLCQNVCLSRK